MKITHANELIAAMEAQNWTVETTANGHFIGKHPDGKGMVTFANSRDPSAIKNACFMARRQGLKLDNEPEKENTVADKTETDNGLIRRKRVLLEKCEVNLGGAQINEAIRQYLQKQTGIYPPTATILVVDEDNNVFSTDDVEIRLEWSQERVLKEGETA
jgi:hypothetical protein